MSLTLGDNFSYQGAKPLDARLKYDTVASMKAVADSTMYDGCLAYCTEADKTYQWKSSNTADSTLGKWREFESGSGGGGGTVSPTIINKTLTAAGWDSSTKQQTVVFTGYDTDLGGVIGVPHTATAAQKEAYSEAIVNVVSQSGTSFTFSCENVPEIDLPVTLYAGGGGGIATIIQTYSPTEKLIGTWQQVVDGVLKEKPLYEKTIYKATQNATEGDVLDTSIKPSTVTIVKTDAMCNATQGRIQMGSYWIQEAVGFRPVCWDHANGLAIACNETITDVTIIIQYFKASDSWQVV